MMDGITVLSQAEIMEFATWVKFVVLGVMTLGLISGVTASVVDDDWQWLPIAFGTSLILSIIIIALSPRISTGEYEYKITIDDTVNFVEFNEQYEILDQEGKIFIIKERTNED